MLTEFESKIVKSLETIAECVVKSTNLAEEAMKKNRELQEANMAMMKESQIKIEHIPYKIELSDKELKFIDDPVGEQLKEDEEDEDMPF